MIKKRSTTFSRRSVAVLSGVLLLLSSFVQGAIVTNGGFEDNADLVTPPWPTAPLTGWTIGEVLGTPPAPLQNRVDGLDPTFMYALGPHTGNIAAAFNSNTNTVTTGGLATLTQSVVTDPAKTYDLSLWIANPIQDPVNFNNIFSVSWNGTLITLAGPTVTQVGATQTYLVTPNTAWFQVTATNLVVTGTSTSLVLNGRNSDWATLVDDVSIVETPEPTTLVMFGAAFVVFGLRRARRARVSA